MNTCKYCGKESPGAYCSHCGQHFEQLPVHIQSSRPQSKSNSGQSIPVERLPTPLHNIAEQTVTERAVHAILTSDEDMMWNGTPAPLAFMDLAGKWILGILFTIFLALAIHGGWGWVIFWIVVGVIRTGFYVLGLRSIRYLVSTQRLEVTSGFLHRQTKTYEVHHLGDITINSPLFLQLFGLSNLTIRHEYGTVDTRTPLVRTFTSPPHDYIPAQITLLGINAVEAKRVRDILRRAGEIEAGRLDKLRFR